MEKNGWSQEIIVNFCHFWGENYCKQQIVKMLIMRELFYYVFSGRTARRRQEPPHELCFVICTSVVFCQCSQSWELNDFIKKVAFKLDTCIIFPFITFVVFRLMCLLLTHLYRFLSYRVGINIEANFNEDNYL